MAIIHVPIPAIPPNFLYVKAIIPFSMGTEVRELYSDHFFMSSGSLSSFNVTQAALTDFLPLWFRPVFDPIRTTTMINVAYQFFANVSTHVQSILVSPSWSFPTNGPALGQMWKPRVSRQASSGVDFFWGRFTFPPIPLAWLDGNYINSTGAAAYQTARTNYLLSWGSQGLLFTPAGWSRKYSTVYPITKLRQMNQITHDRKSRWKDLHFNNVYRWPTVL